jgi:hypothetical protein
MSAHDEKHRGSLLAQLVGRKHEKQFFAQVRQMSSPFSRSVATSTIKTFIIKHLPFFLLSL